MCTDHHRSGQAAPPPTITRVPLALIVQPVRWTRRHLLVRTGLGSAGIAILSACSSDSGGGSAPGTAISTPPAGSSDGVIESSPAASAPTDSATTNPATSAEVGQTDTTDQLQLQHVSLGFVSAYVLVRGTEAAIVDTGTAGSGEAIVDALAGLDLTPRDVRHVILTHNHGDHVGGLGELEGEMSNATVYAGAGDVDTIQTSLRLMQLADGDEVFGMGVIGTPGHTAGSISVFDTGTGLLVAGDAINGNGEGGLTGANPDFSSDMAIADASLAKLAAVMPRVAAFGHGGPPVTVDVAAKLAALV